MRNGYPKFLRLFDSQAIVDKGVVKVFLQHRDKLFSRHLELMLEVTFVSYYHANGYFKFQ